MGDIEVRKSKQDGKAYIVAVEYDETGEPYYQKLKEVDSTVLEGPGNARGQAPGTAPDSQVPSFMSETGGEAVPEPPKLVKPGAPIQPMPRNLEYVPPAQIEPTTPYAPIGSPLTKMLMQYGRDTRAADERPRTVGRGIESPLSTMTDVKAAALAASAGALPLGLGNVAMDVSDAAAGESGVLGERVTRPGIDAPRANPVSMRGRLEQARSEQPDLTTGTDAVASVAGPAALARLTRLAPILQSRMPSRAPTLTPSRTPVASEVPAIPGSALSAGLSGLLKHGTLGAGELAATEAAYAKPGEGAQRVSEAFSNPMTAGIGVVLPALLGGGIQGGRAHVQNIRNDKKFGHVLRNLEDAGGSTSVRNVVDLPEGMDDSPQLVTRKPSVALDEVVPDPIPAPPRAPAPPRYADARTATAENMVDDFVAEASAREEGVTKLAEQESREFYSSPEGQRKLPPMETAAVFIKAVQDGETIPFVDSPGASSDLRKMFRVVESPDEAAFALSHDQARALGLDVPDAPDPVESRPAGDFIDAEGETVGREAQPEPQPKRMTRGSVIVPPAMEHNAALEAIEQQDISAIGKMSRDVARMRGEIAPDPRPALPGVPAHAPGYIRQKHERTVGIDPKSGLVMNGRDPMGTPPPKSTGKPRADMATTGPQGLAKRKASRPGPEIDDGTSGAPSSDAPRVFVAVNPLSAEQHEKMLRGIAAGINWKNAKPNSALEDIDAAARRDRRSRSEAWAETKDRQHARFNSLEGSRVAMGLGEKEGVRPRSDAQKTNKVIPALINNAGGRHAELLRQMAGPKSLKPLRDLETRANAAYLQNKGDVQARLTAYGNIVGNWNAYRLRADPVARAIGPTDLLAPHELTAAGIAAQRGRREEKKGEKPKKKNED